MVIPLLVGLLARGAATEAGAGLLGRTAAGAAGHYGANALQRGVQNRQQGKQPDHGMSQWVRANPGEALATGTAYMMRGAGSTLRDRASDSTSSILQSTQFR
jgi:hypothetical protein